MARNTFQGLLRTTCGRPASVIGEDGLPANVLRMTVGGLIQIRAVDLGANTKVVGMLPAYFMITAGIGIVAPAGGTLAIDLPAYKGLAAQSLVAAAAVTAGGAMTIVPAGRGPWGIERPISITGVAGTTGQVVVGLQGFPLDDGAVASD